MSEIDQSQPEKAQITIAGNQTLAAEILALENIQPGIYFDISNEAYHAGPGISKTGLDLLNRSPFHLHAIRSGLFPKPETKSQYIGRAFHALVLEPDVFAKTYCLPLRKQDVELDGVKVLDSREEIVALVQAQNAENVAPYADAIRDADVLIDMINELNKTRQPKISLSGNKADLVVLIMANIETGDAAKDADYHEQLAAMKVTDLREQIEKINEAREGLLSTSGSKADLAARLRENGVDVCMYDEIVKGYVEQHGRTLTMGENAPRAAMVEWLAANGKNVVLWSDCVEKWKAANSDKIVLEPDEWTRLHHMERAVRNHPTAAKLLFSKRGGHAEVSVYWIDPETGELMRCRVDWLRNDCLPVDLKTADDASEEGFLKHIANYRYDVSEALYLAGLEAATGKRPPAMPFVVVENKPPFAVGVYTCGPNFRATGQAQFRANVNTYAECKKNNVWPAYADAVVSIDAPTWHVNRNAHLIEE